jgi:hypothetical protein
MAGYGTRSCTAEAQRESKAEKQKAESRKSNTGRANEAREVPLLSCFLFSAFCFLLSPAPRQQRGQDDDGREHARG